IDELAHPQAGLEKKHHNREISSTPPCYLEQGFVLSFEKYCRVVLFPERPLDGISRIAIDDLIVFEEFEESPDTSKFAFACLSACLLAGEVVYKLDNVYTLNTVWDIPVYPPG